MQGVNFQLYLKANCHTSIIMPCTVDCNMRFLLHPQYWTSPEVIHISITVDVDGITVTGTKSKIMVASSIFSSILNPNDTSNPLVCSSLFNDACEEMSKLFVYICRILIELFHIELVNHV